MATRPGEVRINITGNADRLKKATGDATQTLGRFETETTKKLDRISTKMGNVGKGLSRSVTLPIIGGLALIGKAAMDEEANVATFEKTLANAGVAPDVIKSYDKWITKVQESTGFGDSELRSVIALQKQRGYSDEQTKANTKVIMDLARSKGITLDAAEKLYTKGIAGSSKQLIQLGIDRKKADGTLKTSAELQAEIAGKVAGSSDAYAASTKGQMEIAKQSFANLTEELGTSLLPIMTDILGKLTKLAKEWGPKIKKFIDDHKDLITKIVLVVAAVGPMLVVFSKVIKAVKGVIGIFKALKSAFLIIKTVGTQAIGAITKSMSFLAANPVFLVVIAIVALIAIFVLLYKKNKAFKEFIDKLWQSIQKAWDAILGAVKGAWEGIKSAVEAGVKFVGDIIKLYISIYVAIWNGLWAVIKAVVTTVWDWISAAIQLYLDGVKFVIQTVLDAILLVWNTAWNLVKTAFSAVWDGFSLIVTTVFDAIVATVKGSVNLIIGFINTIIGLWNGLAFSVPGVHLGPVQFDGYTLEMPDIPKIPKLHSGGVVPGRMGQEVPTMLQAGELVLTAAQAKNMNMGAGHTFNINVSGSNATAADIAREIAWQMKTQGR